VSVPFRINDVILYLRQFAKMTRAAIQRHLRIIGCKLDTHCTQKQLFQRTRLMLLDGDAGRTLLPVYDQRTVTLAAWLWSSKYRLFHRSVITMVLLLAFFERASVRPLSPPAMWSETITASLEIVLLVFLVIDAVLSWKLKRTIKWKSWLAFKVYFVVVAIACICVNAVFPVVPKFHRALRPVVVIASSRSVRRITSSLLRSLVRIIRMAGLLFVHVVVFSVVAFLLFGGQSFDTCSGPPSFQYCSTFTQQCTDYFGSVGMAMRQLFILLTTANFPDVMLPAYKCNPWSAIFFIVYLLLGLSFLLNIVLATSYTAFQANNKTAIIRRVLKRNLALDAVFYAVIDYHRHTRTTVLHPSTQSLDNDLMGACW
jgi:Ion transport protein